MSFEKKTGAKGVEGVVVIGGSHFSSNKGFLIVKCI